MRRVLLLLGLAACAEEGAATAEVARSSLARATAPSDANVQTLSAGNRAFAFDLYHQVASQPGNLVLSPYSASAALAMAYAGARTTTESEMAQALHFTLEQAPLHEAFNALDLALRSRASAQLALRIEKSLWVQRDYPLVPAFLDTLALNYGAAVHLADFADPERSRLAINALVSEQTEALIPELLRPGILTPLTRLVLTDSVYFEASWATPFAKGATQAAPFTKLDGTHADLPLMHVSTELLYAEGAQYQAIAIPYAAELRMIAILPAAEQFAAVEAALDDDLLSALKASLRPEGITLGFPAVELRTQVALDDALQALGMKAAFANADFSGMVNDAVRITDVVQEATLSTSEEGTRAAAATAVVFGRKSAPRVTRTLQFDRPFLYLIEDVPTGTILFLGRVVTP